MVVNDDEDTPLPACPIEKSAAMVSGTCEVVGDIVFHSTTSEKIRNYLGSTALT